MVHWSVITLNAKDIRIERVSGRKRIQVVSVVSPVATSCGHFPLQVRTVLSRTT